MNGIALVLPSIDNRKLPDRFFPFNDRDRNTIAPNQNSTRDRSQFSNPINAIAFPRVLNLE
ncbi:MAG: hypothetical protein J7647_18905 [Cyanobacteria bacterium SBLK]|nr:hypothetical protein [Cyanobacteria bacterium SBLK]